jgi:hypothetical protein
MVRGNLSTPDFGVPIDQRHFEDYVVDDIRVRDGGSRRARSGRLRAGVFGSRYTSIRYAARTVRRVDRQRLAHRGADDATVRR